MNREELIEKMLRAEYKARCGTEWEQEENLSVTQCQHGWAVGMAAALDVAVGELLGSLEEREWHKYFAGPLGVRSGFDLLMSERRSRYLPKSDPAVEAVREIVSEVNRRGGLNYDDYAERIVAAVRKADKSLA